MDYLLSCFSTCDETALPKIASITVVEHTNGEQIHLSYGSAKVVNIQDKKPVQHPNNGQLNPSLNLWKSKLAPNVCDVLCYEENFHANFQTPFSVAAGGNQFLAAFILAYNKHEDIVLSPDDLWLHISLEFSGYINESQEKAEKMRNFFVNHTESKHLEVRSDKELSESEWGEFFDLMLVKIEENTKPGVVPQFKADFTTTGQ